MRLLQRFLSPIVDVRREEIATMLSMFAYSFLAMTAYNIVQPITRSQFIDNLGADNLPYVLFASGILIGFIMQLYTRVTARIPTRSIIPVTQVAMVGLLFGFWALFRTRPGWAAVGFYFFGLIYASLLISQFWTLANGIYDPRQAKRLFGFIGGGASLGGMTGAGFTALLGANLGTNNLLLCSAVVLLGCAGLVMAIFRTERAAAISGADVAKAEEGVSGREAIELLRKSRQVQLIALLIGFAALGATILDLQLSLATAELGELDAMTQFLAQVRFFLSLVGFVVQVWLTSRIHRYLGIGFALLILPVTLTISGIVILGVGLMWTPALGSVLDRALRYTVDKTTREVLFLPVPTELKYRAKPFVDVTVDRLAKGFGALLLLVLIKPWGLNLHWTQLTFATFVLVGIWFVMAVRAKRAYLEAFRRSIEAGDVKPDQIRLQVADLSTVETLVEELAHPDERRVLYAIDVLESLDKRNLVTPLLLHHESPAVRARALRALSATRPDIAARWVPTIQKMIADESAEVRAAALGALAAIRHEDAAALARTLLQGPDPRIVSTAAVALSASGRADDREAAERALAGLVRDGRADASAIRRDLAIAVRLIGGSASRQLLIPLLQDPDPQVAEEAMRSVRALGTADALFVPVLVSMLGNRRLKSAARETLVSYGEPVVDSLGHFLKDPHEHIWVRRHIPATLARIPCQRSMDILVAALEDPDSFLRFKVLTALEKLHRDHDALTFSRDPIERRALKEGVRYYNWLSLHHNLFVRATVRTDLVLARALEDKITRAVDRIYRLLALLYPARDVAAARWAIERGNARARASALEYLDNLLTGQVRHRLMPILDDAPLDEKVRRGNVLLRTRPRDVDETMLQLINDDDQIVAAAAIHFVRELELWSLADDLEYILAHRDPGDWFVFEAASWTLAAYRLGRERRRALWMEPLPAAALVKRLRPLPMFASIGTDELFRLAGAGRQERHDTGVTLLTEGAAADTLYILLDGTVRATGRRAGEREISSPATLGFEEVLEGRLMSETIRTAEPSVSLSLSIEDVRTLLADNPNLVEGLFRTLVERSTGDIRRTVLRGAADDALRHLAGVELAPIQKVLALQRVPIFSQVTAPEMLHLAAVTAQLRIDAGAPLATETDPPAIWMVLSGEVSVQPLEGDAAPLRTGSGDVIGAYETLAGVDRSMPGRQAYRLVAATPASVLRIERDDLFDLLGQRPDLLQQMFVTLFGQSPPDDRLGAPAAVTAQV